MSKRALPSVQPSLPELFEHATFLRRLAGRLVGPEKADDLVQEAYTAALTRPPARERLKAWLAVVVANLARRERRSAARRLAREERAARPERSDDSTLALERLDLQRALSAYVVTLPEEQRTVLYLRYFEDQKPSAIAARLGVPVKTIESRHTRALANLRSKLDERAGGDRAAWVSAMAAWALPGVGSGALVGAGLAAAVALVGFGAWYGLRSGDVEQVAPVVAVAVEGVQLMPEAPPSAPIGLREPVEVEPPRALVGAPARLSGTVRLSTDGRALAGVRVQAYAGELGLSEATTDASGAFAFEWSTPATVSLVEARASADTTGTKQYVSQTLAPGARREIELFVSRGATVAGHVVDENGAPVPGAEVLGWCAERIDEFHPEPDRRVRAGADGSFRVEHLGESFVLLAEAPGRTCATGLRGELTEGSRAEGLTLELAPARSLRGIVVDEQGRSIEGVRFRHDGQESESDQDQTEVVGVRRFHGARFEGQSGADGRFELGPTALSEVSVLVSHDDFLSGFRTLQVESENRIVLARGLTVSGRVFAPDGQPLEGVRVRLGDCRGGRARTDAQGRWSIDNQLEAESAYLIASAPGFALAVLEPVQLFEGMPPLELRLAPELALAGRILAADGSPLAGARLLLEGEREVTCESTRYTERTTWEWAAGLHRSTTDEEGRFRYGSLNPGEYALTVVPGGGASTGVPFRVRAGDEGLELALDPSQQGVTFRGRVLDGFDRRPLASFHVSVLSLQAGGWMGPLRAFENTDGAYELGGFAPGRYRLLFRATGRAPFQTLERDFGAGVTEETITLHPATTVGFELEDEDVVLATLVFEDLDGHAVGIGLGTGTLSMLSLNPGEPLFAQLPRIPLIVTARAPRCAEVRFPLDLTTPPDRPIAVPLALDPLERRTRFQLGLFVSSDPAVRALRTLEEQRLAFEQGRLELPDARIELEFLEADGTLHGRGSLEPRGDGLYAWSTTLPDEEGEPVQEGDTGSGPGFHLELPARVTTLRLSGAAIVTTEVELGSLLASESPLVVLTPRD